MADWLAPFHLPKFTDDAFEKQKDAYNEKNGYVVTIPTWSDIVKISPFTPLSDSEAANWKAKKFDSFTPERLEAIRTEKARRKQQFRNMLASPSPKALRTAGAVLTALDDTQDALATIATVGLIAAAAIGGTTAAVLSGPLGWILGATALLNMINPNTYVKMPGGKRPGGRSAKRSLLDLTDKNPFSKKSRARSVKNISKFRPSVGNAIEALQVTEGIFGIGISLGPIMGLAQDIVSGMARQIGGKQVSWKFNSPSMPKHTKKASDALKANAVLQGYVWQSDIIDDSTALISANLALQMLEPYVKDWNPYEQVNDLQGVMIPSPTPKSVLIEEIIEEDGFRIDECCNWPQNEQNYISLADLYDSNIERAQANFVHFADQNKFDPLGLIAANNVNDFALGQIEAIEGPDSVQVEYSTIERIIMIIFDNNWEYPADITQAKIDKFETWCRHWQDVNHHPDAAEIYMIAQVLCGFTWQQTPVEIL